MERVGVLDLEVTVATSARYKSLEMKEPVVRGDCTNAVGKQSKICNIHGE